MTAKTMVLPGGSTLAVPDTDISREIEDSPKALPRPKFSMIEHGRISPSPLNPRDLKRFWAKVDCSGGSNACWLWTGCKNNAGYGQFHFEGKTVLAHRFAKMIAGDTIPNDLTGDHLCRRPACCNPSHIEIVPKRVNTLRGVGATSKNAEKTQCLNGHAYTPANTVEKTTKYGTAGRECRECRRERDRARTPRNRKQEVNHV